MHKKSSIFPAGWTSAKLYIGPTIPRPGPAFPKVVATVERMVDVHPRIVIRDDGKFRG